MSDFSQKKIIVATHYRIYSASQALRDYLRKNNCKKLLYISHPLPLEDVKSEEHSYFEISNGDNIIRKKESKRSHESLAKSSFLDMFFTLWWVAKSGKYDLFVGVDNLNALAGIIFKFLGRTKKVVYYTIDYFPTRFDNKLLNWMYHFIDKVCVKYADETWNVSNVMIDAREKYNNMDRKIYNSQYRVPIGIWYDKAPRLALSKIDTKKLVFAGHLLPHMGIDLVVSALPKIVKKIPNVTLEIIGGGQELENLKKLSKELKVSKHIKFWGWVRDRKKLEEIMSSGAVGLATFNTDILDDKVKNADPGKIKDYMLLGMPVIVTDAISNAEEIRNFQCGIVIDYKVDELVSAVVQLLKDKKKLKKYRANALEYVKQFDYNTIFSKNLKRIFSY